MHRRTVGSLLALVLCCTALPALAADAVSEPVIVIDGHEYLSWLEYHENHIQETGQRCLTPSPEPEGDGTLAVPGTPTDCSASNTNPSPDYDPDFVVTLDVVVHVIRNNSGTQGNIPVSMVESQIEIINEDFLALAGTNGENGNYAAIQFQLATEDPDGLPTNGITYSDNTTWFNDSGSYWNTLAWDPTRYINVYTNLASGALGYVPWLPQTGSPGSASDRVVILWSTFGLDAPYGPPYDQGRTLTHELGHYFGLEHVFTGGCAASSPPNCYKTGDLICDTNPISSPTFGCPTSRITCGFPAPFDNYMDYSDDLCMEQFTDEQVHRMRCTLFHYRASLDPGLQSVGVDDVLAGRGPALLHAARPNPFRPQTEIAFDLPSAGPVELRILDVTGRTIRTLVSGERTAGSHSVAWDGRNAANAPVAAGVYFYRIETAAGTETRRVVRMN